ncbi:MULTISPECIES: site-specific integrase [Niastella]|uniref:Site-specific integrase n=1 Tax=Niastella soli TaxID=2821487 RepID=A0ABS3YQT2_9BACT|nr:site-specific integrase [Niastella soli]MBO9200238.1 site-specific integrase [Niastella soli]
MKKGNQNLFILFRLFKGRGKNGKSAIYLRFTINQKRVELSTNLYVDPKAWDSEGQLVKGKTEEVQTINRRLTLIKADLHKKYLQLEALGKPITAEILKNLYLGIDENQKHVQDVMNFYYDRFAEKVGSGQKSKSSLNCVHTTREKVKQFLKHQFKRTDMLLREIKPSFAGDFEHFLMTHEKGCSNTAMKYIRIFKRILKFAVDQGWLAVHPLASFKCTYKEPPRERLTMEEVTAIYAKEIEMDRLGEVRDVFIFSCYTGFAYQDVFSLTPDDIITGIDGEKWIVKNRAKTSTPERVPLLPIALDILDKYKNHPWCINKNRLLPVNSNQCYNGYLKEIAIICGIKKHLTTHMARHTFATTITLEHDVPIETVSQLLGHKSIKTTQIYAKVSQKKVSQNMKALREKLDAEKNCLP